MSRKDYNPFASDCDNKPDGGWTPFIIIVILLIVASMASRS